MRLIPDVWSHVWQQTCLGCPAPAESLRLSVSGRWGARGNAEACNASWWVEGVMRRRVQEFEIENQADVVSFGVLMSQIWEGPCRKRQAAGRTETPPTCDIPP